MSIRPNWLRAATIAVEAPMYRSRSEASPTVRAPSLASFSATSWTIGERSTRATTPPSRAALVATASPRPCAAPVTTMTLSSNRPGKSMSALTPRLLGLHLDAGMHRRLGVLGVSDDGPPGGVEVTARERVDHVAVVLGDVGRELDRRGQGLGHVVLYLQPLVRLDQRGVARRLDREQVERRVGLAERG